MRHQGEASTAAPAPAAPPAVLRFGAAEIDLELRELRIDGRRAPLGPRAFALLCMLVDNRHRPVSKHELLDTVWQDLVVEENNLQVQVSNLRRLLGPQAIATVPGRGYRFVLPESGGATAPPAAGVAADAAVPAPAWPQGNLAQRLPPLYGRAGELGELLPLIEQHALLSVVGPAGIGKTRLAQAASHAAAPRYPDGVWAVELATLNDPGLLVPTVAQALRLGLPGLREPAAALAAALRAQRMLLLLDNCEHLVDEVGALLATVLREAGGLHVLTTTQEPLRLPEEYQYRLAPLALPPEAGSPDALAYGAVELFVERVRALMPRFALAADNSTAVVEICRRLDGLPLAIELAAARVPVLGVAGVHERLGERFRVLTGGSRVAPRRHQTLRAALDWSHSLLSEEERIVYRRLGVFIGSFSLESAQGVAASDDIDAWAVLEHLGSLVDKSLVLAEGGPVPRYRLLESTREYALEQLASAGETDFWLARHAEVTRAALQAAITARRNDRVLAETANVRIAYDWARARPGQAELAVALATLPAMVLAIDGAVTEARQRLLEVEPLVADPLPPALQAQYWQWLGRIGLDGRLPAARCIDALERAERMYDALGRPRHVHACRRHLAEACLDAGDLARAQAAIGRAGAMESEDWPLADRMRRLRVEGLLLAKGGQLEAGLQASSQALAMAQFGEIDRYELVLLGDIARMHLEAGHAREAAERCRALATRARRAPSAGLTLSQALADWVAALTAEDRLDEAAALAREALPVLRRAGILMARAEVLACLLARQGRLDAAARLLGASDRFRRQSGVPRDAVARTCRERALALVTAGVEAADCRTWLAEGENTNEDGVAAALLTPPDELA